MESWLSETIESGTALFAITVIVLTLFMLWAAEAVKISDEDAADEHTRDMDNRGQS